MIKVLAEAVVAVALPSILLFWLFSMLALHFMCLCCICVIIVIITILIVMRIFASRTCTMSAIRTEPETNTNIHQDIHSASNQTSGGILNWLQPAHQSISIAEEQNYSSPGDSRRTPVVVYLCRSMYWRMAVWECVTKYSTRGRRGRLRLRQRLDWIDTLC